MNEYILHGQNQPEPRLCKSGLVAEAAAFPVEMMEQAGQFVGIARDAVRCPLSGGIGYEIMVRIHLLDEVQFRIGLEKREIGLIHAAPDAACFPGLCQKTVNTRIGILDIVHRVFTGFFLRQVDIEFHLAVQRAAGEEIPRRIGADFVDEFGQRDGFPGAFGHFHGFAVPEERHHLEQVHIEVIGIVAEEFDGRLQTDDVAVMIGAPDIDQLLESAVKFILRIGDIRAEIGGLAIGADDHAVLVVSVVGRAEPPAPPSS